tara:strand:+ start:34033 stop:34371 length:339 start_codon:yes stop_codon:yes gene_type:complete
MNEFLLVFRRDYKTKSLRPSPDEIKTHIAHWENWYGDLEANGVITIPPQEIEQVGKIVRGLQQPKIGPFRKNKKSLGGFVTILADNYESAVEIAKGCPILELNGNVEVRKIY